MESNTHQWPTVQGKRRSSIDVASTGSAMLKAIRAHCKDCCGGPAEKGWRRSISDCTARHSCPLWPYRFGKTPRVAVKQGLDVDPTKAAE